MSVTNPIYILQRHAPLIIHVTMVEHARQAFVIVLLIALGHDVNMVKTSIYVPKDHEFE